MSCASKHLLTLAVLAALMLLPPTIAADGDGSLQGKAASGWIDGKTGKRMLQGNVQVRLNNIDLSADEAESTAPDGIVNHARLRGNPARLRQEDPATGLVTEAQAREIDYDVASGRISLRGAVELLQRDTQKLLSTRVIADDISVLEKNNRAEELTASGAPARISRQKDGEPPLSGAATRILYLASSQYVKLEGAAGLTQGQDTVEHDVIEHDGVNERTSTPRLDGKQMRFSRQPTPAGSPQKPAAPKPAAKKDAL